MNSYSYDQQPADLKISVTLRASPDKVADLYAKFGGLDTAVKQVVSPAVNQQVKIVFGRYTAVKAIQERGALNNAIKDAITASLRDDPMIIVESVQLENIEFSSTYLHSIEQRMLAEVEVQKLQQNAERGVGPDQVLNRHCIGTIDSEGAEFFRMLVESVDIQILGSARLLRQLRQHRRLVYAILGHVPVSCPLTAGDRQQP